MISVFSASPPLKRVSTSGEQIEERGMPTRRPEYHGNIAICKILKAYARKVCNWLTYNGRDSTVLPMLDKQDAPIAEEKEAVASELVVAAVYTVDSDASLDVNEDGDWEPEGSIRLDKVECVEVKRKLRGLQKMCRIKRREVPTSVAEAFSLANKLLGNVDAHMFMAERAALVNRGEKFEVEPETVTDEEAGGLKALSDAQMKATREDHARKLNGLCKSFKARKSKLLQERDE